MWQMMMSEPKISNQWTCECNATNQLRARCCVNCGREVPKAFLEKVYKEEIYIQNIFFRRLGREKEIVRCKRVGKLLEQMQTATLVVFVTAIIACNGARFYYFPNTAGAYAQNYFHNRVERLQEEFDDAKVRFSKNGEDDKKNLNKDKVNHMIEKIKETANYVKGKL
jgi:hypothetical protein